MCSLTQCSLLQAFGVKAAKECNEGGQIGRAVKALLPAKKKAD